jgi:hypothetical protein
LPDEFNDLRAFCELNPHYWRFYANQKNSATFLEKGQNIFLSRSVDGVAFSDVSVRALEPIPEPAVRNSLLNLVMAFAKAKFKVMHGVPSLTLGEWRRVSIIITAEA